MYSKQIDKKWQRIWAESNLYRFNKTRLDKKFYCLEMFSYPSGANLHLGHWYNFGLTDIYARFKRLNGYNVFQPMGYDAFGLPAENYAIKSGIHPKDSTNKSIATMTEQLKEIGAMFNWENTLATCEESYYKWTQWLFLKLYENGLAYRKKAPANWCPDCKTVLANEQVIGGKCERCKTDVYKKDLTQWFFKITQYADELIDSMEKLDWPERTKKVQTNWIGRSYGSKIKFKVSGSDKSINVFTTRADTLMGATYLVIAPEHTLINEITTDEHKKEVDSYVELARSKSEIERMSLDKNKSGAFTGAYAIHPLSKEKLPVWIADYVLPGYGTGCVMAVPAHDTRDFKFAQKYELPVKQVIKTKDQTLPTTGYGHLINSNDFDGMDSASAQTAITRRLSEKNSGGLTKSYRLRDWLISRQRYWGAPIPIIYCDKCGVVPVPEKELPVSLPYDVVFEPNGVSPLKSCESFLHTTCPICKGAATRETDTMDTFVCSSWYFLRYPDASNDKKPFDEEIINSMLPVDKYVGGAEHATMHLLYARFITKALRDIGHLSFDEPFLSLVHQGNILGSDGKRMSKSKPEFAIAPDAYIEKYGADVLRLYLAFGFAYEEGGKWDDNGFNGIVRFVARVEKVIEAYMSCKKDDFNSSIFDEELNYVRYNTIKMVAIDIEKFQFNTCIARMMELTSALESALRKKNCSYSIIKDTINDYIKLLAPFAPHLSEELWSVLSNKYSIFSQKWPEYDERSLTKSMIEIPVQINSKVRTRINITKDCDESMIKEIIKSDKKLNKYLEGAEIKKIIIVKNKIVNIIL